MSDLIRQEVKMRSIADLPVCQICGRKVLPDNTFWKGTDRWTINGALLGDYVRLEGHRRCLQAVEAIVIMPNRLRLARLQSGVAV